MVERLRELFPDRPVALIKVRICVLSIILTATIVYSCKVNYYLYCTRLRIVFHPQCIYLLTTVRAVEGTLKRDSVTKRCVNC
jgi:hypothetical protein